jgi:hypothetical protein
VFPQVDRYIEFHWVRSYPPGSGRHGVRRSEVDSAKTHSTVRFAVIIRRVKLVDWDCLKSIKPQWITIISISCSLNFDSEQDSVTWIESAEKQGWRFMVLTTDATLIDQAFCHVNLKTGAQNCRLPIVLPFKVIVSAPPGAGKTELVLSIIKNRFQFFPYLSVKSHCFSEFIKTGLMS